MTYQVVVNLNYDLEEIKLMLDRQTISTKLKSKQILTVLHVFALRSTIIVDLTLNPI